MEPEDYQIVPVESAPFAEVAYVIWRPGRDDALVIDPGFDTATILGILEAEKKTLAAILNTHGHVDHIAGNARMKESFPDAPLIIGKNEVALLGDPEANLSAKFGMPMTSPGADRLLSDGERLELAGFSMEVREIPGHSPGSIVYLCDAFKPHLVFGGDVLFSGSVGRTDLGGDGPLLVSGIRAKLFNLPDDTAVLPGHGPMTTVGRERRFNPFVGEDAGLYGIDPA